jgi:HEAT repeat protein
MALGKLGDHRAVEPLIDLLNDPAPFVRKAAVQAPGTLGGAAAIESLVAALRHRNKDTRTAVADALDNLGWRPDNSEAGAEYWAVRGEWDECVKIGAPALEILIAAIESEAWGVRMAAAAAIVAIYQSGRLDEHQKARLLAQRGAITRAHADQRKSFTPSSDCTDHSDVHTDEGIGLDFLI